VSEFIWYNETISKKGEQNMDTKMDMTNMKFCQSCGMPMAPGVEYGTEEDGSKSTDYCSYCYQNGKFTDEMTMEEMINFCIPHMAEANPNMSAEQAKEQMLRFFPMLKRWKTANQ